MSDIQKIDTNRKIDHGGITLGQPFGFGEGRDAPISSQNITDIASKLLNEFKLNNQKRESLVFSTFLYLDPNGQLRYYQSDLPYPSKSNFSLVSTINTGLSVGTTPQYMFNYVADNIYIASGGNIKLLLNDFSITDIANSNYSFIVSNIDKGYAYLILDNQIYELDLKTNTSSLLSTVPEIAFPYNIQEARYSSAYSKMIVLANKDVLILDHSSSSFSLSSSFIVGNDEIFLSLRFENNFAYLTTITPTINDVNIYIHEIDLVSNNVSTTTSTLASSTYTYFVSFDNSIYANTDGSIYYSNTLYGKIPKNILINSIDINNNALLGIQTPVNIMAIYDLKLLLNNKIQKLVEL